MTTRDGDTWCPECARNVERARRAEEDLERLRAERIPRVWDHGLVWRTADAPQRDAEIARLQRRVEQVFAILDSGSCETDRCVTGTCGSPDCFVRRAQRALRGEEADR